MKVSTGLALIMLLAVCSTSFAQKGKTLRGQVVAGDTQQPLERVVIVEKGSQNHVFTGATGDYSITLTSENATLIFSYVGYATQQLPAGSGDILNVTMQSSQKDLHEVVVTAFGVKKEKRALGYTIQQVDNKDLNVNHQPNVVNALQGKVAGVQISSSGGGPGQGSRIIIRGINSISGDRNNQPLFIVDGVEIDNNTYTTGGAETRGMSNRAADINPDDIESVSVLRGGAATALYGIRAANGAIVITTKSGKAGKLQVTYNGMYGFDKVNKTPEVQSKFSQGYLGEYDPASFWPTFGPTVEEAKKLDDTHPDQLYNNYKQAFKTGTQTRHTVNVSGGTDKAQLLGSMSYLDQDGVIPFSTFTSYNARINGQFKISEKFSAGVSLNYINSGGNRVNADRFGEQIIYWSPRWDMKDYVKPDGTQQTYSSGTNNPIYTLSTNKFRDNVNRTIASTFIMYKPASWLNFSYRIGNDFYTDGRVHQAPGPLGLVGEAPNLDDNEYGFINEYNLRSRTLTSTIMANVTRTFKEKYSIDLKIGHDLRDQRLRRNSVMGDTLVVPDLFLLNNAKRVRAESYIYDYRNYGYFADLTLGLNNYLFLELTGRTDLTSTLSINNRSYFYPSVSLSYIFSDQFKLPDWWTYGKFKASWAKIGKDGDAYSITNGFKAGTTIGSSVPFYQNRTLGNPNLRPEFTQTTELGTELRFLEGRLGLEAVVYQQQSKDLLVPVDVSTTTGFDKAYVNAGEISNKGLELTLSVVPVRTKDFSWDFRVNFSTNSNKVKKLNEELQLSEIVLSSQYGYLSSTVTTKLVPGQSYGALYGRTYKRYYGNEPDDKKTLRTDLPLLIGANGFPVLDDASNQRYLGSTLPKWIGSTTQTFRYKQLSLSLLLDVRHGNYKYNQLSNFLAAFGESKQTENRDQTMVFNGVLADGTANTKAVYLGQAKGPDGVDYGAGFYRNYYRGASENFIEDASWVRLRSLSLSYTLPAKWLTPTKTISGATVSFTGNNLWLHTKYSGFDPETSSSPSGSNASDAFSGFTYPATRSFLFSLNLQF
ncbi:SusC/RagA family TonB-linked outer membrane protein [Chitinophaga pinensis]|uniref:TonB-dependent receptor plug n=1 Tax=Chitinophaga pinensis (strain ATCC 43595 / DSM 2588 / LMG 13176 / NBRC 15968 / NCIMB 11800 / UQM 2034) TaxID=485918 RepID=A0A979G643_CHIPD|nr:SusC/RagA family TonB-linked outer membrane protein [Chitinophaga pinensis]ACU61421.1 TonB-dependent receptor plug [Chitinophaga pinensis DSM 2588]